MVSARAIKVANKAIRKQYGSTYKVKLAIDYVTRGIEEGRIEINSVTEYRQAVIARFYS